MGRSRGWAALAGLRHLGSGSVMDQLSSLGTQNQLPMRTAALAETGAFLVSSGNRQTFAPERGTVTAHGCEAS